MENQTGDYIGFDGGFGDVTNIHVPEALEWEETVLDLENQTGD